MMMRERGGERRRGGEEVRREVRKKVVLCTTGDAPEGFEKKIRPAGGAVVPGASPVDKFSTWQPVVSRRQCGGR